MPVHVHLRDLLMMPRLMPLSNNILAAMITVLYFRCAIELAGWMRVRFGGQWSRQFLQLMLSLKVLFWPLFDTTDWSWRLSALLPTAVLLRLLYKAKIMNDPDDVDVLNWSLSSSPSELLYGPLQLCLLLIWIDLYHFMTEEAAIIAAACVGDALAPFIGIHYGRHKYQMPLSNAKTMEGSIVGVFLGTVAVSYMFLSMMGLIIPPFRCILVYGILASSVEGSSPGNFDNIMVPLVMHLSMNKVKQWVGSVAPP